MILQIDVAGTHALRCRRIVQIRQGLFLQIPIDEMHFFSIAPAKPDNPIGVETHDPSCTNSIIGAFPHAGSHENPIHHFMQRLDHDLCRGVHYFFVQPFQKGDIVLIYPAGIIAIRGSPAGQQGIDLTCQGIVFNKGKEPININGIRCVQNHQDTAAQTRLSNALYVLPHDRKGRFPVSGRTIAVMHLLIAIQRNPYLNRMPFEELQKGLVQQISIRLHRKMQRIVRQFLLGIFHRSHQAVMPP